MASIQDNVEEYIVALEQVDLDTQEDWDQILLYFLFRSNMI